MAIWDFLLKVNGTDATSLGFYVESLGGPWDTPSFSFDEAQIPEHDGPIVTHDDPQLEPKEFKITGSLLFDTETNLENGVDAFKFALSRSDLTIIVGNRDTRERTGRLVGSVATVIEAGEITEVRFEFTVRCFDPIARDTSNTTVTGAAATDHALTLGTWKSWGVASVTGPTSPLVLTGKDSAGSTIGSLTVTFPGTPTTVVVDMGHRTITVDGVRQDSYLTAGDFFALDPRNGDRGSNLPTFRYSSGSALSLVYQQAWL